MYDPKFENAVQRKMEELEFRPSESVWVNIEKAVSARRRRRVIPIFWRLLIPAMLVTVVGGAYYFGKEAGRKAAMPVQVKAPETAAQVKAPAMAAPAKVLETPARVETTETPAATEAGAAGRKGGGMVTATNAVEAREEGGTETIGKSAVAVDGNGSATRISGDFSSPRVAAYFYRPGLEDQRIAYGVSAAAVKSNRNVINLSTLSRVRRPWEAGFVAGAGIDRLNQLDDNPAGNVANSMTPQFYSLSRAPVGKNDVSEVKPGASFYAGIYLQKPVSDRWVFHTGLDLHYYSTNVSVGQQVSVIASPSASLLNQTSPAAAPAPQVYAVGDQQNYTNRYYLLELPVSMQYRVNRSRLLPLFLEGGGSVSRLMGAAAIFYNPTTGLFVKDENVLNKTMIDVSSALLVGLPFHGVRVQAGPEVQYALTPLSNAHGLGDQHFFYAGIRLVVLPGRK